MQGQVAVLVVSGSLDNKRTLTRILNNLPVDVFTATTVAQARDVLLHHRIAVIFCEESLADGPYYDLLAFVLTRHQNTQLVVMLRTDEQEAHWEAKSFGVLEALRYPLQPTDVELALINAMRANPVAPEGSRMAAVPT